MKSKVLQAFDFERADRLLEGFSNSTGFVTAILDLDGKILSQSGWRQICTDFHRRNPETLSNCIFSGAKLAGKMSEGKIYHSYQCINGLTDIVIPLVIKGEHIANIFSGQFFLEEPEIPLFRKQAKRYGFDERTYLEALEKVPVISKEKVEAEMKFLHLIIKMLADLTAEKLEQMEINEELKNSEENLRETQVRLEQNISDLLETQKIARLGTWRLDIPTNEVVWSEALYRMYGLDPGVLPPPYTEQMKLFTPESWERVSSSLERTRTTGIPYELELETVTNDGSNGWIWARGEARKDEDVNITELWGAVQDITERKRNERELVHSRDLMRYIIEHNRSAVAVHDKELKYLYVSQRYIDDYRVKEKDIIGKHHYDVFPDLPEKWREVHRRALRGEISSAEKDLYIREDGTADWTRWECRPWYEGDGSIGGIILYTEVITERIRIENELMYLSYHDHLTGLHNRRYFEEELENMDREENLPLSVIMCDVNGLKLVNDSFGHDAGDHLLHKAAETIRKVCRDGDIIARIGGDEFIILLPITSADETVEIANNIKELASKEMVANVELSISYGYDTKASDRQSMVEIIANAENHMYRHKLYERSSIRSKTVDLIMNALFEKSKREASHSKRVSNICSGIASEVGLDKDAVSQIKIAGLIHDIGKIGIDENILNKTGRLIPDERSEIEKHPEIGWRLLSSTNEFSELAQFVLNHHEKWDGSGYPHGIKGEAIPIEARIIAIADAYDAMTSKRSYQESMSMEEAVEELRRCSGTHFDPAIVQVFLNRVLKKSE